MRGYASTEDLRADSMSPLPDHNTTTAPVAQATSQQDTSGSPPSSSTDQPEEITVLVLKPFAPSRGSDQVSRPSTRAGSDYRSATSGRSIYSSGSGSSNLPDFEIASFPSPYNDNHTFETFTFPAKQYSGLGIDLDQEATTASEENDDPTPQPRKKYIPNFARPFAVQSPASPTHFQSRYTTTPASPPPPPPTHVMNHNMIFSYPSPTTVMASPTFTADTIDTPGFTTPHRLSGNFLLDVLKAGSISGEGEGEMLDMDSGILDVEKRLSRLLTAEMMEDGNTPVTCNGHARSPSAGMMLNSFGFLGEMIN